MDLGRGVTQQPFAPGPTSGWQSDHTHCREGEGGERNGHAPPQSIEFTDPTLVGSDQDGAGAEKQGDLTEGVHDDVQPATHEARGCGRCGAQHDIGQLADGGIGQSGLEIVLVQRDERGHDEREAGHISQPQTGTGLLQKIQAENVIGDLEYREHPGLDHRYRMQQRAHRCRRHHGARQPAVKRHKCRLADAEQEQGI